MAAERPKWHGGKSCAAMITVNLNAELFWLQIDPECKNMPKTLSLGQYGICLLYTSPSPRDRG